MTAEPRDTLAALLHEVICGNTPPAGPEDYEYADRLLAAGVRVAPSPDAPGPEWVIREAIRRYRLPNMDDAEVADLVVGALRGHGYLAPSPDAPALPNEPQTDAGKRLLDYILSGFEGDDDPAALVVAVERASEAWGKFRGIEMVRVAQSPDAPLREALDGMRDTRERLEAAVADWRGAYLRAVLAAQSKEPTDDPA